MSETSFEREREAMVSKQVEARGVRDPRVLAAMRRIPRHVFVPEALVAHAYEDSPLAIGHGQTISQPYMVAAMTEMLRLRGDERVLEIGLGSGYQAAILAQLAREVVSMERIPALAESAERRLRELTIANVRVCIGDGTLGCAELGPFDAILVTAAGPDVPGPLKAQLTVGGRLLCPVGQRDTQRLTLVLRRPGGFEAHAGTGCVFVPLIGSAGWPEHDKNDEG